jgi:cellulose synthase/poly-beta-1,6-N-acetylglucosamine synthase-like glycosyltransferase
MRSESTTWPCNMISVVISYYKNLPNLELILTALNRQSDQGFEVIVSEDDEDPQTQNFLQRIQSGLGFPIQHLQQPDLGFRKNRCLNKSIRTAKAKLTQKLQQQKTFFGINFSSLLFSKSKKRKEHFYLPWGLSFATRGLKGCNWGVQKADLMAVNGYDESYEHATVGEDDDISWRLQAYGLKLISMKNKAIVYHLDHPRSYSQKGTEINSNIFKEVKAKRQIKCLNGLDKI